MSNYEQDQKVILYRLDELKEDRDVLHEEIADIRLQVDRLERKVDEALATARAHMKWVSGIAGILGAVFGGLMDWFFKK